MPLNIGANGNIKPYVKYNAKADKWFMRGEEGDVEIARPTFAADFANIRTGWLKFREGQAPERRIDPSLVESAPQPDESFKRGFVLSVYSKQFFSGLVELSSASFHTGCAIKDVYQVFEEQRADHPGQVPVIAGTGSESMKDKYGTNYRPTLQLLKWIDRPAEMPDESPVDPADVWRGDGHEAPKAGAAQHVAPPAAKPPAPEPAPAAPEAASRRGSGPYRGPSPWGALTPAAGIGEPRWRNGDPLARKTWEDMV